MLTRETSPLGPGLARAVTTSAQPTPRSTRLGGLLGRCLQRACFQLRQAWPGRFLHRSPDKRHQIDAEGPARHSTGNTDRTNCIHNSAKFAMLETSRDITDLAIFMTEMIPDVDVSGLAALRNKVSALNSASMNRTAVPQEGNQLFATLLAHLLSFLDSTNPSLD